MKRIILIAFLFCLATQGYAQTNTFIGIYGGAGLASSYNYNAGISGGLDFLKGIGERTSLGASFPSNLTAFPLSPRRMPITVRAHG